MKRKSKKIECLKILCLGLRVYKNLRGHVLARDWNVKLE